MHKEITQQLPLKLKVFLCYRRSYTLIAIAVLIIGGLFSSVQLTNFDFREFFKLNGNTALTKGVISSSYYTGVRESIGDDGDYRYINAYVYEYNVNNEDHKWVSYSGKSILTIGQKVNIVYNINSPQYSVIKGFRHRANGISVLFLLIIPVVALFVLCFHIYKGLRFLTIITNGIITNGKLSKKEVIESDDHTSYKLNFVYYSDENKKQRHNISIKTSNPDPFEDENKESIIFDKNNPDKSFLLDDLASPVAKYIKKNWLK